MSGPSHQREQKERREIITAEARARKADTMSSWARAEHDLENVGRFAKGTTITGADPATHYPRLPPWPLVWK